MFAAGMFTVLNGPLWLSVRARFRARGPEAPRWLVRGVSWASRVAGIAILAAWAWLATGDLKLSLLLGLILAIGLFCLFDGPWRITTGMAVFRHGSEAPARTDSVPIWLVRLAGVVALLSVLVVGITSATS